MEFALSTEQRDAQKLAREFTQEILDPYVRERRDVEWAGSPDEIFPTRIFEEAEEFGLRYFHVPERFGGNNLNPDVLTKTILLEELSTGDQGIATSLGQLWKGCKLLREFPESVQEEWFPRIVNRPSFTVAHLNTEPRGASDRILPYDEPEANMNTTAERDGDEWVIDGIKNLAACSYHADLYVVTANTDPDVGVLDGTGLMVVPRDANGVEIGHVHESLGHRFMDQAEVIFDHVRIPDEYVLMEDTALRDVDDIYPGGRVTVAAPILGPGIRAYEATLEYVNEREQGGKPIGQHQMVKNRIAEMAINVETARTIVWRAAKAKDEGRDNADRLAIIARIHAAEAVFSITRSAMEIHGGAGVMRDQGIEKLLRDAATSLHGHGTQDIHKLKLANADLDLH